MRASSISRRRSRHIPNLPLSLGQGPFFAKGPPLHSSLILALPLGELSAKLTERALLPYSLLLITYFLPLRPRCAQPPPPKGEARACFARRPRPAGPKPPLCKGRCQKSLIFDGGIVRLDIRQSPSHGSAVPAPFTQGGLFTPAAVPRRSTLALPLGELSAQPTERAVPARKKDAPGWERPFGVFLTEPSWRSLPERQRQQHHGWPAR